MKLINVLVILSLVLGMITIEIQFYVVKNQKKWMKQTKFILQKQNLNHIWVQSAIQEASITRKKIIFIQFMAIFSVNLTKKKRIMKKWARNIMKPQISEKLTHQVKKFLHFIPFGKIFRLKNHLHMQTFMMSVQHLIGELRG